jgi:glycerol kinase
VARLILPFFLSSDSGLQPSDITCLGVSTQRGTFVTWSKSTGKPFHNFITWKDLRADALVKEWDSSFWMKVRKVFFAFINVSIDF